MRSLDLWLSQVFPSGVLLRVEEHSASPGGPQVTLMTYLIVFMPAENEVLERPSWEHTILSVIV